MLKQTKKWMSSLGMGLILLLGCSSTSLSITLNYQEHSNSEKSDFMNKLALTLINYDHYTNVASNLDFNPLTFTLEQRKDLASKMNSAFVIASTEPVVNNIALPSLDQGISFLAAKESFLEENPQLNLQEGDYTDEAVEIAIVGDEKQYDVALMPQADSVDQIYDDIYQFNVAVKEELTLSSSIGRLLGKKESQSQRNIPNNPMATYEVAQKQIISDLNQYARERRSQMHAARMRNGGADPVLSQISTPAPPTPNAGVNRGNWFQFYAMSSTGSDPSAILGNGVLIMYKNNCGYNKRQGLVFNRELKIFIILPQEYLLQLLITDIRFHNQPFE